MSTGQHGHRVTVTEFGRHVDCTCGWQDDQPTERAARAVYGEHLHAAAGHPPPLQGPYAGR